MIAFLSPRPLVVRVDGHVGDIGAVEAVGQHPPGTDENVAGVNEAHEHAVAEHRRERFWWLFPERGDPV